MLTGMRQPLPLVSAVITTWNGERYLRETIDSALMQNYPALEIVVVDDGSTDLTEAICRSYGDQIRYFRQLKDDKLGATAYVRALHESRGKYIAVLDHDDRWLQGKIKQQVQAMEAQPEAGVIFTRTRIIDDQGVDQGLFEMGGTSGDVFHLLLESNRYCHASAMYRPEVFEAVGGLNMDIGCGDWDLWLRIARDHPVIMLDDVLTEYRVHSGGYSQDPQRMVDALKRVILNQRGRWHAPDCPQCQRASARGIKATSRLYIAHFHAMARAGRKDGLLAMFFTALREAPDAMLAPRNLATIAKSVWLYARRGRPVPGCDPTPAFSMTAKDRAISEYAQVKSGEPPERVR